MGTDFTYADLEYRDVQEAELERKGDEELGGRKTWKIEARPTGDDELYSRIVLWIDKELHLPLKMDFYDRKGKLLKVLKTLRIKKRDSGAAYASRLKMESVQEGTSTVIQVESLRKTGELKDALFDPNLLGK